MESDALQEVIQAHPRVKCLGRAHHEGNRSRLLTKTSTFGSIVGLAASRPLRSCLLPQTGRCSFHAHARSWRVLRPSDRLMPAYSETFVLTFAR